MSYTIGQLVATHPATDAWMAGYRYGTVAKIGRKYVHLDAVSNFRHRTIRMPISGELAPTPV